MRNVRRRHSRVSVLAAWAKEVKWSVFDGQVRLSSSWKPAEAKLTILNS